jgi:uncharacterized membrane protein YedE/YeeE
MSAFTPMTSLAGGVLVGLAATMLLAIDGKIAGISGIVVGLLRPVARDTAWRATFVLGLVVGGAMLHAASPETVAFTVARSSGTIVSAGLLVGLGSRLANGCTSGHGVCGISRGSPRSIVATLVFMVTGACAAYVVGHVMGGYR